MAKKIKKYLCSLCFAMACLCINLAANAQSGLIKEHEPARNTVWEGKIERNIRFLADSICQGRATGTRGNAEAAFRIVRQFGKAGLLAFDSTYVKHFYAGKGLVGHNIVGMIPGSVKYPNSRYVVVGAHYDHLGNLGGNVYPGADANASGTVALTCLADMFSAMKTIGRTFTSNIIFVAFDAKEMDMAGSQAFFEMIERGDLKDPLTGKTITKDKIRLMVNIDQIGTTLAPIHKDRKDYLIMLGSGSLPRDRKDALQLCNRMYDIKLDIGLDYYGSETFTKIFYRLSDQRVFVDNKIPAVLFTSGITMNTNRTRDTAETISLDVMKKRIYLIYHWLTKML